MQKQQISATLKDFQEVDRLEETHTAKHRDRSDDHTLRDTDFKPFKAGIKAKADAVMVSHLMLSM